MAVLPGSGSGWVSILGMLRLLIHPTGMCKMPGQGVLVGLAKSLEKLSSGFRINRAADDAAGLAISEGLRTQVGGNRQAVRNAQDGISLVQTAEGALNEVHSILQRMRVLAVQGATDSNSPDARDNINTELSQLRDELDRIGNVTNFNGTSLLNGSASGSHALKFQVGANGSDDDRITVDLKDADVTTIAKFGGEKHLSKVASVKTAGLEEKKTYLLDIEGKSIMIDIAAGKNNKEGITAALAAGLKAANFNGYIAGGSTEFTAKAAMDVSIADAPIGTGGTVTLKIGGLQDITINTLEKKDDGSVIGDSLSAIKEALNGKLKDKGYELDLDGTDKLVLKAVNEETKNKAADFSMEFSANFKNKAALEAAFKGTIGKVHGTGFEFAVDGDKISFKRADGKMIDVDLSHSMVALGGENGATPGKGDADVVLTALGADGKALAKGAYTDTVTSQYLTVKDHDSSQELIRILDQKIRSVSTARSNLGAVQNRFEHTIANLNVAVENLAASESRIRDTDMAQEMMQFTRNQILSQAGTSMLAQANQVPQGVLSLLR
ncbi:flagellin [Mobiluncus mulieris]|uniref:Flagellin n=1 Tax=Mobiluncus mulieris TaxID=2052 RepID=A0A848RGN5_9ACTO|nr:flagellin [Mobiluncus mulieris]NMW93050.1 flagellin [Mobiluncus mulieris]